LIVLPLPVLRRLPNYLLLIQEDRARGVTFVSSTDWARRLGATPIQVRKDLAWTGAVGVPKKGFALDALEQRIRESLGRDNRRDVFLVGCTPLGLGLLDAPSLGRHGFSIVGIFDPSSRCSLPNADKRALAWEKLPELAVRMGVSLAILAVEAGHAQRVTDRLVGAGLTALWNLTGRTVQVPEGVTVVEEDFGARLAALAGVCPRVQVEAELSRTGG